jgi:hypothetical protein
MAIPCHAPHLFAIIEPQKRRGNPMTTIGAFKPLPLRKSAPRFGEIKEYPTIKEAALAGGDVYKGGKPFAYLGIKYFDIKDDQGGDLFRNLPKPVNGGSWMLAGSNLTERHWVLTEEHANQDALDAHYATVSAEHPTHEVIDKQVYTVEGVDELKEQH